MTIEDEVILPFENRLQEAVSRERAAEDLDTARCPLCRMPLRVRMDCQGPRFECACERRAA